jgi:hypothetical protein
MMGSFFLFLLREDGFANRKQITNNKLWKMIDLNLTTPPRMVVSSGCGPSQKRKQLRKQESREIELRKRS